MKLLTCRGFLAVGLACFVLAAPGFAGDIDAGYYDKKPAKPPSSVIGEAVVRVVSNASVTGFLAGPGYIVADSIPELRSYLIRFDGTKPAAGIITALRKNPNVDFIEPNETRDIPEMLQVSIGFPDQARPIFTLGTEPTNYYDQAGTYNTGIESAQTLATGEGVVVAVIDNGIDYSHPLTQTVAIGPGFDFVDNDTDPSETSGFMKGHGTFVSGLIWLTAPECTVLPLRAFDGNGAGKDFAIAKALVWSLQHDVDAVNMSFGAPVNSGLMTVASEYLLAHGVTLVAAAGNEGSADDIYPAAVPGVIAVSSIDQTEHRALWANYGPYLTLVAPGVNLYSALANEYEWGTWSGTSFSAPLVTGTVALILERRPGLTPDLIHQQLTSSARVELLWGTVIAPSDEYGFGALDAYQAVSSLNSGDIDGNGTTDALDLAALIAFVKGESTYLKGELLRLRADMNRDGLVNLTDITLLVSAIAGNVNETR